MITLKQLPQGAADRVAHLVLPEAQVDFVGPIADMVADTDPDVRMHYAAVEDAIIGFFKVDLDLSRMIERLPKGSLGIRGLLIGGQYQGRGYGKALLRALPDYLRACYPDTRDFWLSVDVSNDVATKCYQDAGWQLSGPQRSGRAGKEHVMRLALRP